MELLFLRYAEHCVGVGSTVYPDGACCSLFHWPALDGAFGGILFSSLSAVALLCCLSEYLYVDLQLGFFLIYYAGADERNARFLASCVRLHYLCNYVAKIGYTRCE